MDENCNDWSQQNILSEMQINLFKSRYLRETYEAPETHLICLRSRSIPSWVWDSSRNCYLVVYIAVAGVAPDGEVGVAEDEAMLCLQSVHQHVLVYETAAVHLVRGKKHGLKGRMYIRYAML